MKKFALTSTHSAGKTTLINEIAKLEEFKGFNFITERTRYLRDNLNVKLNDDSEILSQYSFLGERAQELFIASSTFTDRSIYDVMAYTLSAKSISDEDKNLFIHGCLPLIKYYDVIFYVDPSDVKIEDNGLRSTDAIYRDIINIMILHLLEEFPPKQLYVLKGTTEERIKQIKQYLEL